MIELLFTAATAAGSPGLLLLFLFSSDTVLGRERRRRKKYTDAAWAQINRTIMSDREQIEAQAQVNMKD